MWKIWAKVTYLPQLQAIFKIILHGLIWYFLRLKKETKFLHKLPCVKLEGICDAMAQVNLGLQ